MEGVSGSAALLGLGGSRRDSYGASSDDDDVVVWRPTSRLRDSLRLGKDRTTPRSQSSFENETPLLDHKRSQSAVERSSFEGSKPSSKKRKTKQTKLSFFTPRVKAAKRGQPKNTSARRPGPETPTSSSSLLPSLLGRTRTAPRRFLEPTPKRRGRAPAPGEDDIQNASISSLLQTIASAAGRPIQPSFSVDCQSPVPFPSTHSSPSPVPGPGSPPVCEQTRFVDESLDETLLLQALDSCLGTTTVTPKRGEGAAAAPAADRAGADGKASPGPDNAASAHGAESSRDGAHYADARGADGKRLYIRMRVTHVESAAPEACTHKCVTAIDERTGAETRVILAGIWVETVVAPGDYFNLVPTGRGGHSPAGPNKWVVDNEHGLVVMHPDVLVSGTRVGSSFPCARKAVLSEVWRSRRPSAAALYGTVGHHVFEQCLLSGDFSDAAIRRATAAALPSHIDELYGVGKSESDCERFLLSLAGNMRAWKRDFYPPSKRSLGGRPPVAATTRANLVDCGRGVKKHMRVTRVIDIEEGVWCPAYGLKGVVDASLEVSCVLPRRREESISRDDQREQRLVLPFELKTGKRTHMSHRAQVLLYTLMMSDRYSADVRSGLLYNVQQGEMVGVAAEHQELRALVMRRNLLARHLRGGAAASGRLLPPVLGDCRECSRCFNRDACMVAHRAFENGSAETSGLPPELFDASAGALTQVHLDYMRKWHSAIDAEHKESLGSNRDLWNLPPSVRRAQGRCASHLILEDVTRPLTQEGERTAVYTFSAAPAGPSSADKPFPPLSECGVRVGDMVAVSTHRGNRLAVCFAIVTRIDDEGAAIRCDRGTPLTRYIDDKAGGDRSASSSTRPSTRNMWRLDKYEFESSVATLRTNVLSLFLPAAPSNSSSARSTPEKNGPESKAPDDTARLRSLVVDLAAPRFAPSPGGGVPPDLSRDFARLNADQRQAIERVLSAQDYVCLHGMPGTGKSTTVVFLVRVLAALGKTVLLTSYTHAAVDNLLKKLQGHGVPFARFGKLESIDSAVYDGAVATHRRPGGSARTLAGFRSFMRSRRVVATTCLGVSRAYFQSPRLRFDYCIVDEAGQMTQPAALGPLRLASQFVLVGDHCQLPPLCRSERARELGYEVSLFKRLSDAHPSAVVRLGSQYRMNADIQLLSNELVYGHRLRCGNDDVASARLVLPRERSFGVAWLDRLVSPSTKVAFVDTDAANGSGETRRKGGVVNVAECRVVTALARALVACGLEPHRIGVISTYRLQLAELQSALSSRDETTAVCADTVDKFQGLDRDCIIVSLVRSNDEGSVGRLLRDWRRVNVAITRAKRKLVLVGSVATLRRTKLLNKCLELITSKGWNHAVPANGLNNAEAALDKADQRRAAARSPQASPPGKCEARVIMDCKADVGKDHGARGKGSSEPNEHAVAVQAFPDYSKSMALVSDAGGAPAPPAKRTKAHKGPLASIFAKNRRARESKAEPAVSEQPRKKRPKRGPFFNPFSVSGARERATGVRKQNSRNAKKTGE